MNLACLSGLPEDLWQRDAVLRHAEALLQRLHPQIRAVSFDFFDTLVWRWTAEPTGVFSEVGRRLQESGRLPRHVSPADYRVYRRMAEVRARERRLVEAPESEDITLQQILRELQTIVPESDAAGVLELAAEEDLCCLNPAMVQFAVRLKDRGLRLLIISDVYLSGDHLRGILRANGLDPAIFDAIYTSGEAQRCKGTGNLFRKVLGDQGLKPEQLLHLGDNVEADVAGAHRAGVRALVYEAPDCRLPVVFERERFLLGACSPTFALESLRVLAARAFTGDRDIDFFGRFGAAIIGPVLTRFAGWACDQFAAAGVRRVGAFMREGALLGRLLEAEARARRLALEVEQLYANRKATELAALGRLTAQKLVDWLNRRQTLTVREIMADLGLGPQLCHGLKISPGERLASPERVIELARFLFRPEIARRIEERSAEERRKVVAYLQPWLQGDEPWGVCDIGYNASAQWQLHEILRLEGLPSRIVGCYVVTTENAALRALNGLDVRHYLGNFGHPTALFWAFLRSPAFVEQLMAAPCGTTLGYDRGADGRVRPRLDQLRFPPELLERQKAFQDGVLWFQRLWLWVRGLKPSLLDGRSVFSQQLLNELDAAMPAILARAAAFPLREEVRRFGALVLDDYYFAGGVKALWGESERKLWRAKGYLALLSEQGVLWPQAVHHVENPRAADEFFGYGSAMLGPVPGKGREPEPAAVAVIIAPPRDAGEASRCLGQLTRVFADEGRLDVMVLAEPKLASQLLALPGVDRARIRLQVHEREERTPMSVHLHQIALRTQAPVLLFLRPDVELPAQFGDRMARELAAEGTGAVVPHWPEGAMSEDVNRAKQLARCLMVRRQAFLDGGGLSKELPVPLAYAELLRGLKATGWKVARLDGVRLQADPARDAALTDRELEEWQRESRTSLNAVLEAQPGLETQACEKAEVSDRGGAQKPSKVPMQSMPGTEHGRRVAVDWIGTFLDHGSLSHVNREFTRVLSQRTDLALRCVAIDGASDATFAAPARQLDRQPNSHAAVTVRHAWPPDWTRPGRGRLVVIQPWEFGSLPVEWIQAAANVDEFWVPSNYVRQVYVDSGIPAEKVVVVPNGVDPARFRPDVAPRALPTSKRFRFLFVGGTIFRKGPDLLLEAYGRAFTAADDVCLVIKDFGGRSVYAGQTFGERIKAFQARPGAPEIVYLDEEWPPEELPGLYTACHCLVLPYRGEGFGLPVLEAMACGLPVIVTAGGATDDFVRDAFGWRISAQRRSIGSKVGSLTLVRDGWVLEPDLEALIQAMQQAAGDADDARARGREAAAFARTHFSWVAAAEVAAARLQALAEQSPVGGRGTPLKQETTVKTAPVSQPSLVLPPCALLGNLRRARELWLRRDARGAWQATLQALEERPFHPEAYLLMAEIARGVGAGKVARRCAEHARRIAPGYKPARKFAGQSFSGDHKPEWMELPEPLRADPVRTEPRLTVCLITRDEEQFLGQCLESVRGLAHQIVVVDTGSKDRTVEIARAHGAEVYHFSWCDDFSAARNAALEHARGDWVLMLDADEELTEEGRARLPEALRCREVIAWRLPLVDVGREAEGPSYVPRLFRNAPGLFYVGRVHEQVFSSLEVRRAEWGLENRPGDVRLRHHGYRPDVVRDRNKIERNLRLLEQAVRELPEEPHLLMNLGLELARSGRETEALQRYREAFEALARKPAGEVVPELRETLLTQLASRLFAARQYGEVIDVLTSPLAKNHGGLTASLHFSLGLAYLERGQFREAADQMRQCLAKRDRPAMAPVLPEIRTAAPHHCLALALWRSGDRAGAAEAFAAALQGPEPLGRVRLDYARFLVEQQRPVDALRTLTECVTQQPDLVEAWRLGGQIALSQPEFLEFAQDWTGEAMRYQGADLAVRVQRASALLLSGEAGAALDLWQAIEQESPQPEAIAARLICTLVSQEKADPWQAQVEEAAVSRAFLQWYQRLARVGTRQVLLALHETLAVWSAVLPTAGRVLEAAVAEAQKAQPVAAK
jgi:glycosyltransferase involved in cell wall biosynthesis/FMN phosphatase YigB (HAD superfamily)/tetratricopeptide (TPR) repeat protein